MPRLRDRGGQVVRMIRQSPQAGHRAVLWDPSAGRIDLAPNERFDAVVHLAGENLASGRWTAARKQRLRSSRLESTRALSEALARLTRLPQVLLAASAVGYYGNRADHVLTEASPPGTGFLAELCQAWEAATAPAGQAGIRVVHLRFGIILSSEGGALSRMLRPFRWGVGGKLGSGRQFWSWIALEDAIQAILHALVREDVSGPLNVVSPQPVTNDEFTRTLGRVLHRPTWFAVPAAVLRMALGEMADEALLSSARVHPERLVASGFQFKQPELEAALRRCLG